MVEVDVANVCHLLLCALLVEAVDWDERALLVLTHSNALKNLFAHCCLARRCPARYPHENGFNASVHVYNVKRGSACS